MATVSTVRIDALSNLDLEIRSLLVDLFCADGAAMVILVGYGSSGGGGTPAGIFFFFPDVISIFFGLIDMRFCGGWGKQLGR